MKGLSLANLISVKPQYSKILAMLLLYQTSADTYTGHRRQVYEIADVKIYSLLELGMTFTIAEVA